MAIMTLVREGIVQSSHVCALLVPCHLSNSSWTWANEADGKCILSMDCLHSSSQAATFQCVRHFKTRVPGTISIGFLNVSLLLTIMCSCLVIHQINALEILLLSVPTDTDIVPCHFWDDFSNVGSETMPLSHTARHFYVTFSTFEVLTRQECNLSFPVTPM